VSCLRSRRNDLPPVSTDASIAAYLFDLDGTLLDTAEDIASALNRALATVTDATVGAANVRLWVGQGAEILVASALEHLGAPRDSSDRVLAAFADHYARRPFVDSRLYDGVPRTLAALKARRKPLAVVTNKLERVSRRLVEAAGIASYFDVVICGDEVERPKPHPDLLLAACAALGTEPARTLMVGDSGNDVLAARAAGCPVVCVSYGYNHGRPIAHDTPDRVIDSLLELL
jgi:phosphoglycolate phosphatase